MAHILVADDDAHIREVVRFALEREGHRVTEAADGQEALDSFETALADLVVLDIVMPEKDGLEVCRRLRERSAVPILFLSSRDEELDRILGLEMGADDYVTKPFSPRELAARAKAMLDLTYEILPPAAAARPPIGFEVADEAAVAAALAVTPMLRRAKVFTLTGARLVDRRHSRRSGPIAVRRRCWACSSW